MEEQGRVSRASSVVTISSTREMAETKLQSFSKRSGSVQRDPNCAVVIRGWLYKRDSMGLKLWKKRWFVLSNYCLFYYKDSREEGVLGSLPLPSYKIFFCSPRECKNRKYAFKVVHQGMRSYLLSADTQEDMLGWVRALSQSANMETDDFINRRCSSYHDFSQIGGSSESVTPLHGDRSQSNPFHHASGSMEMVDHRGRHRAPSLDRTGDHFLCQGSGPSTPRSHYESRSHSPVGRVDPRHQEILCAQLPPLPPSRITHNPPGSLHHHTAPVCGFPPSMHEETHKLAALQGDTDMVLTCLCGCDKVLQTLCVELDLLQQDKEHAEFALDISRIELAKRQLKEQQISQKTLLQEELVTIRARMCDLSQEMERVWLDYKRMESELSVFRSHLQHICHFGLSQERSRAQKQIWMMDDILSGLKPNRSRFKALMAAHTPTMFPLLQNLSLHPEESVHYWGEELEAPARPPLPLEINNTNETAKLMPEWAEPKYTLPYSPVTLSTHSSTHTNTPSAECQSLCLGAETNLQSDHSKAMLGRLEQNKQNNRRNRNPDYQTNVADKPRPPSDSSPVCLMNVMRAELPSALTAQRVCVEESNLEEDQLYTLAYKLEEQSDHVDVCIGNRESDPAMTSEERHAKLKRVERIKERVLKSALRRSDTAHPLKFVDAKRPAKHSLRSPESLHNDKTCNHGNKQMTERDVPEAPPSFSDSVTAPAAISTSHISTLTINKTVPEVTNQRVTHSSTTNQRAEWFLSTSHWQEFIPLNIQEEELLPTNQQSETSTDQHSDTAANQHSELPRNPDHFRGEMTTTPLPDQNVPNPSDPPSQQPIGTNADSHMMFHSDHSGRELCIYEEIQYNAPNSTLQDDGSVVGGAKVQQSNLFTNHNSDTRLSANQPTALEFGGRMLEATEEEAIKETGSDVMTSAKTTKPVYSCWGKNSKTNHSDSFLKPRVTVVSTSL
ncbi:pleckstrin homology domain-containing family A member 7 isoform X3 [Silurus meridionalis]|nr:pleckstrin homology domain-containing family A member 7 isoform X3 [Silurus meridionalis]